MRLGRRHHDLVIMHNPNKTYTPRPKNPIDDTDGFPAFHHYAYECPDRENFLGALEAAGELHNFETEMARIDGTTIHVLENVSLLTNGDGESHMEGTLIDITERRELEEQLRQ